MSNVTSENNLFKLRDYFSRYSLPKKLVSDNEGQLISEEFDKFHEMNKIKHSLTAPSHASSNGAVENAVWTFKFGLMKGL